MAKVMGDATFIVIGPTKVPDSVAEDLALKATRLDPADRTLIGPMLADARCLDEILADAQRLLASIEARVARAAAHIRAHALVALPSGRGRSR